MSITAKLAALNDADLSKLSGRIAALKADYEKALAAKGKKGSDTATAADLKAASTDRDPNDFLDALEQAKNRSLR